MKSINNARDGNSSTHYIDMHCPDNFSVLSTSGSVDDTTSRTEVVFVVVVVVRLQVGQRVVKS